MQITRYFLVVLTSALVGCAASSEENPSEGAPTTTTDPTEAADTAETANSKIAHVHAAREAQLTSPERPFFSSRVVATSGAHVHGAGSDVMQPGKVGPGDPITTTP